MKKIKGAGPLLRAVMVIGAVAGLVTSVTYAALSSQATLTANTLSSATAELLVGKSQNNSCSAEANTAQGFAFDAVAPGEQSEDYTFCLKNAGDVDMDVTVYATNSNVSGAIDNEKVHFCFERAAVAALTENSNDATCFTRTQMLNNFNTLPGGPINEDSEVNYDVYVKVDDSLAGDGFEIAPFDLVFTGTQTAPATSPETVEE